MNLHPLIHDELVRQRQVDLAAAATPSVAEGARQTRDNWAGRAHRDGSAQPVTVTPEPGKCSSAGSRP